MCINRNVIIISAYAEQEPAAHVLWSCPQDCYHFLSLMLTSLTLPPSASVNPSSKGRTSTSSCPALLLLWCSHSCSGRNWRINTQIHTNSTLAYLHARMSAQAHTQIFTSVLRLLSAHSPCYPSLFSGIGQRGHTLLRLVEASKRRNAQHN